MSQPSSEFESKPGSVRLQDHFADLTEPRRRKMTYPLVNIVTIAVCAVFCGADDFVAIATWGRLKRDRLAMILDLSAGTPSRDRFNAIFLALDPGAFEKSCWAGSPRKTQVTQCLRKQRDVDARLPLGQVPSWFISIIQSSFK